jgi:hypothetical protein
VYLEVQQHRFTMRMRFLLGLKHWLIIVLKIETLLDQLQVGLFIQFCWKHSLEEQSHSKMTKVMQFLLGIAARLSLSSTGKN